MSLRAMEDGFPLFWCAQKNGGKSVKLFQLENKFATLYVRKKQKFHAS